MNGPDGRGTMSPVGVCVPPGTTTSDRMTISLVPGKITASMLTSGSAYPAMTCPAMPSPATETTPA